MRLRLPSQLQSRVKKIHCADADLKEAYAPQSISIRVRG